MSIKSQEKNQSDLFEQAQSVDKKMRRKTRFLLPDVKNNLTISYETMIFGMIGFVMVCIIAFSLGVEKGRHDQLKSEPNLRSKFGPEAASRNASKASILAAEGLKKGASNVTAPKPKNIKSR